MLRLRSAAGGRNRSHRSSRPRPRTWTYGCPCHFQRAAANRSNRMQRSRLKGAGPAFPRIRVRDSRPRSRGFRGQWVGDLPVGLEPPSDEPAVWRERIARPALRRLVSDDGPPLCRRVDPWIGTWTDWPRHIARYPISSSRSSMKPTRCHELRHRIANTDPESPVERRCSLFHVKPASRVTHRRELRVVRLNGHLGVPHVRPRERHRAIGPVARHAPRWGPTPSAVVVRRRPTLLHSGVPASCVAVGPRVRGRLVRGRLVGASPIPADLRVGHADVGGEPGFSSGPAHDRARSAGT